MKNWWKNLSTREQQSLSIGGTTILLLLIYLLLWSPLSSSVNNLTRKISDQASLLKWMQLTNNKIQTFKNRGVASGIKNNQEPLVIIRNSIDTQQFTRFLQKIGQNNGVIQLTFSQIPFDEFVKWLPLLKKNYAIVVSKIQVTRDQTSGLVDIQVDLVKK